MSEAKVNVEEILQKDPAKGARVSGKSWKSEKKAFRVKSLGTKSSFSKRDELRKREEAVKAKLKELQEEKENERKARIESIKQRREQKEEKERYERMSATMSAKRIERLKRKEKRNKLLRER